MYKILGTDQKEYGPVSAETLRQWITEGRAVATTQASAEGTLEWKPLASFPEFAVLFAARGGSAPPSPAQPLAAGVNHEVIAQQIISRGYNISAGHCLSRSWDLVMKNFWLLVGACFVLQLIQAALPILIGVCQGGMFFLFFKLMRRQKAEFGDAFAGFSEGFLPLFLVGLVSLLLTMLGFIFCVLPGIFLTVAWIFAIPLAMDRKMEFWPAMQLSYKVVCANWWQIFWLLLLNFLVGLLGLCVCFVGIYVALPVTIGAIAYAYEDIFGAASTPSAQPV